MGAHWLKLNFAPLTVLRQLAKYPLFKKTSSLSQIRINKSCVFPLIGYFPIKGGFSIPILSPFYWKKKTQNKNRFVACIVHHFLKKNGRTINTVRGWEISGVVLLLLLLFFCFNNCKKNLQLTCLARRSQSAASTSILLLRK